MNLREPSWLEFHVKRLVVDCLRGLRSFRYQCFYDVAVVWENIRRPVQEMMRTPCSFLRTLGRAHPALAVHAWGTALWHVTGFYRRMTNDVLMVVFGFFTWSRLRIVRTAAAALPAFGAGGVALALTFWPGDRQAMLEQYDELAQGASQSGDEKLALMYRERIVELDPSVKNQYVMALEAEQAHEADRCAALMRRIAPESKIGYAPAHLWLARQLLNAPAVSLPEATAAWLHLERALHSDPTNSEANNLFAQLLLNLGELTKAEPHLRQAADHSPEARLVLAKLYFKRGKIDDGRREAAALCSVLGPRVAANKADLKLSLSFACATALLGNFQQATELLGPFQSRDKACAAMLANLHVEWWDSLDPARRQLSHLQRALDTDRANPAALARVIAVAQAAGRDQQQAGRMLEALARETWLPAKACFSLGNYFWSKGKLAAARAQLEQARRQAPANLEIANNLAWMLAHSEPRDLQRALTLISGAIDKAPRPLSTSTVASLYDTRGDILIQLGEWIQAADDFELVVLCDPSNTGARNLLEQCYGHKKTLEQN